MNLPVGFSEERRIALLATLSRARQNCPQLWTPTKHGREYQGEAFLFKLSVTDRSPERRRSYRFVELNRGGLYLGPFLSYRMKFRKVARRVCDYVLF
jgi:hypothetical protein